MRQREFVALLHGAVAVAYLSGVFAGALKEVTAMKSMLASIAVAITFFAAPAVSAEFPKTGEAEYDTY